MSQVRLSAQMEKGYDLQEGKRSELYYHPLILGRRP